MKGRALGAVGSFVGLPQRLLKPALGLALGGTLVACGARVPVSSTFDDSGGPSDEGGRGDEASGDGSSITLTATNGSTSPTPATSTSAGSSPGPDTTGEGPTGSSGFDDEGSGSTGPSIAALCDNVFSEEHTCITQTEESWAIIGTDTGVLCAIGPAHERLADQSLALAWDGSRASWCRPDLDNGAIVQTDAADEWVFSTSHPCDHLFDFDDEIVVVEPRETGQWATFYPDFAAVVDGVKIREVPVEILGSRVGAGEGLIYSTNDHDPTVTVTALGPDYSVNTTLDLDRGMDPITGIDRIGDDLFILSFEKIERYDPISGDLISSSDLLTAPHPFAQGLICR